MQQPEKYMRRAIAVAHEAARDGGVAIGCVLVDTANGTIVAEGESLVAVQHDPTAHAEINAIRKAASLRGTDDLFGMALFCTLEPCHMCLSACAWAKITTVYFGASRKDVQDETLFDIKGNFSDINEASRMNLREHSNMTVVGEVCARECADLLRGHYETPKHS